MILALMFIIIIYHARGKAKMHAERIIKTENEEPDID
jgi:hypothetical protein